MGKTLKTRSRSSAGPASHDKKSYDRRELEEDGLILQRQRAGWKTLD